MDYAEASYFDGYHFQHIAAYHEAQRLLRIRKDAAKAAERHQRERRAAQRRELALPFVGTEQRQVERRAVFGRRLSRDRSVA